MENVIRILLIDDDEDDFILTRDLLAEIGKDRYALDWSPSFDDGLVEIKKKVHDVCLVDYRLGEKDGLELIKDAVSQGFARPYIMLTGQGNRELDLAAMEAGASDYLTKDQLTADLLERSIRYSLRQYYAERKKNELEKMLLQTQRMESLGRLAGGIAHDFNNMLSVIIGNAEMAMENVAPGSPLKADLVEILKAANRSADITRQLLAFARQQTVAPKVLDLNETVESMLKMIRRLIGEDIDLVWLPDERLWPIRIDPSQVDQILVNLCVNARAAIGGVGRIGIQTENTRLDEAFCAENGQRAPGDYVTLTVSDDGCGIAPEAIDKIFEPFYSSKGLGHGTGLGLSTVYGIVKQNRGFIKVYSEPQQGTTIKIYLPRHEGQPVAASGEKAPENLSGRGETVLLVEDDLSILKLTKRLLESLNYAVLSASSPGEALRLAEKHQGPVALLITDVIMPDMNGRDLADGLQVFYPGLKTLFMSGYTADVIAHRGILEEGICFLPKPFSRNDLAVKVRGVLSS